MEVTMLDSFNTRPFVRFACVACAVASLFASSTFAAQFTDRIRTSGGAEAGEITSVSPLEISIDKGTAGKIKIPVNRVRSVIFDEEPPELTQARLNARNGGHATALERLGKIDRAKVK